MTYRMKTKKDFNDALAGESLRKSDEILLGARDALFAAAKGIESRRERHASFLGQHFARDPRFEDGEGHLSTKEMEALRGLVQLGVDVDFTLYQLRSKDPAFSMDKVQFLFEGIVRFTHVFAERIVAPREHMADQMKEESSERPSFSESIEQIRKEQGAKHARVGRELDRKLAAIARKEKLARAKKSKSRRAKAQPRRAR